MKKIVFYKAFLKVRGDGLTESNIGFKKGSGYLCRLYEMETDTLINVVFENLDNTWYATHLETGLLICGGFGTKKTCMQRVEEMKSRLAKVITTKDKEPFIKAMEAFRRTQDGL